ncbi:unnamed protein product (macronuclear) [Paramecium tetraurelia]|uniref:DNA topoisomerase 2 n=1 Tax=Paramecium tetraurelia TaxID=5888 RepID=A0C0L0_PARTE|nr:uncharacterized protein GSPATT00006180001 [Paramecium tetraurelia]CAK64327.1 unnamed protein product [Paramecium tetraurelia]|eukprot:XP_001431725.1 hypothetical protein (macronuclear) [Paramecium tetraurelia strain d4-2]
MRQKTIEEQYKKMTHIEHILQRPDTYIGSIQRTSEQMWIIQNGKMIQKEIEYVPGFFKIFDEILVNAADNLQRDTRQHKQSYIKVDIGNEITIKNDGLPIPVEIHKEYQIYVPELIFGVFLTGSNFDDSEKRVVGGRNGYGAKLTNVYSTEFTLEVCDGNNYFKLVWNNNMSNKQIPTIKQLKKDPYVSISYKPDYKRFGMKEIEADTQALLTRRVYDLAGIYGSKINVYLNDEKIKINSFQKYVDLYLPTEGAIKIFDKDMTTPRWEVVVSYSPTQFQHVSFVNAIYTAKGGTHVNYVTDKIIQEIQNEMNNNKKYKSIEVQKYQIKQSLWVFINCLIDNPTFDSQTKENMTTKVSEFGGSSEEKFKVTEKFSKALIKTDIIETIFQQAKAKADAKLNKQLKGTKTGRLHGIEKLDDANDAGKKNSELCTLILTEGDSAKALAMAGIDIVGRDRYGVFPLKGKLLNVREASLKQILQNEEIENLIKIIGLQKERQYTDLKSLRYGSVMIMTDQDIDGSHIKGLIINFIHHFWPSLVKYSGFLKEFVTPLIKATKGNQTIPFFTVQDFNKFAQEEDIKNWKIKYYKGLGTSDDQEAQEYFKNLRTHTIQFRYDGDDDDSSIDLCFNKKKANDRKQWLAQYNHDLYVDHTKSELGYSEFIHKELIHFSMADNIRSIPSLMDGLKPGQRKVLFACFKRNLKQEIKVVQLGGYIAEHSAYHHGDLSLVSTIIGMAQNFVGSNNINLLLPKGQFGSRAMGGKDHASARYISTALNKITRYIFPEQDDHLLKYQEDDGQMVEPEYYVPIIPMSLVNGAEGIGTGWSTSIQNYNPIELVNQIKNRLDGQPFQPMTPFYRNFDGIIENLPNGNGIIKGIIDCNEATDIITIRELPIKKWTRNYKEWLDKEMAEEGSQIVDLREYHTKYKIHFEIQMVDGFVSDLKNPLEYFKLSTPASCSNMVLFDSNNKIKKYECVSDIMEEFYQVRLQFYHKRKEYLVSKLDREVQLLDNKLKFIKMVISEEIQIRNVKKIDLVKQLDKNGFTRFSQLIQVKSTKVKAFGDSQKQKKNVDDDESEDEQVSEDEDKQQKKQIQKKLQSTPSIDISEFNYLLSMPLFSLTYEKVEKLQEELNQRVQSREALVNKEISLMWREDLDKFLEAYEEMNEIELRLINKQEKMPGKQMKKPKKKNDKQDQKIVEEKVQKSKAIKSKDPVEDILSKYKKQDEKQSQLNSKQVEFNAKQQNQKLQESKQEVENSKQVSQSIQGRRIRKLKVESSSEDD